MMLFRDRQDLYLLAGTAGGSCCLQAGNTCVLVQVRRSGGAILWQAEVHLHTGEAVRWCHSVAGRGASAHR